VSIKRINIDQQFAQIGVRTTPGKMHISMPKGKMRIRTETPQMDIDRRAPSFKINRKKINNESGLKGPLELSRTYRNKSKQAASRSARNAKDDGDLIANPNIPGDKSVPLLAKSKMKRTLPKIDYNTGQVRASSPEISWDKGHMRINWSKHSVIVDWEGDYLADITIDPKYSIEVYLRTQPYFRVMVEEVLDGPGRYIDHAI